MPKEIHLPKGALVQRSGELHTKVYLVRSGLLRSYSIDQNGKESTFMFAPEGWTMADTCGPDTPSDLFIEALEASTVLVLDKDLEREKANVGPLTRRLHALQKRVLMLLSTNAIERYEHFVETYPDIVHRVPQRMIASYIGVNPETLSAAKAKRLRK